MQTKETAVIFSSVSASLGFAFEPQEVNHARIVFPLFSSSRTFSLF